MKKVVVFLILSIVISCEENYPPECSITSPDNGSVFVIGDTVEILVDAWDWEGDIVAVNFDLGEYHNGIYHLLGYSLSYPYRFDWDTRGLGAGEETIRAVVYDYGGGKGSDEITIILEEATAVTD